MIVTSVLFSLVQLAAAAPYPAAGLASHSSSARQNGDLAAIQAALAKSVEVTTKSWEFGTLWQASLELNDRHLTPFGWNPSAAGGTHPQFADPNAMAGKTPYQILASNNYDFPGELAQSSAPIADFLSGKAQPESQSRQLIADGSLGDPAALGTATWLLAMLGKDKTGAYNSDQSYAWAAASQLKNLRSGQKDPQGSGIYSHRTEQWQLWSDQGYMISPFISFLGLARNDTELLGEALSQWRGLSSALIRDNLYVHMSGGANADSRLWTTGSGWMLAGLMRILASIDAAGPSSAAQLAGDVAAAKDTAAAVFKALFAELKDEGADAARIPNFLRNSGGGDLESAGTAIVAAAFYRFYALAPDLAKPMEADANRAYNGVMKQLQDGVLRGCVDPSGQGAVSFARIMDEPSPEGQSFVVLMYAARQDAKI